MYKVYSGWIMAVSNLAMSNRLHLFDDRSRLDLELVKPLCRYIGKDIGWYGNNAEVECLITPKAVTPYFFDKVKTGIFNNRAWYYDPEKDWYTVGLGDFEAVLIRRAGKIQASEFSNTLIIDGHYLAHTLFQQIGSYCTMSINYSEEYSSEDSIK